MYKPTKGVLIGAALLGAYALILADQSNAQSPREHVRVCAVSPTAGALVRRQPARLTVRHSQNIIRETKPYWMAQDSRARNGWMELTGGSLGRTVFTVNFVATAGTRVYRMTVRFNRLGRGCGISRPLLSAASLNEAGSK